MLGLKQQEVALQERYMRVALQQAEQAAQEGEVPVGACIVKEGMLLAVGRNTREQKQSPFGHAEMEAIAQACQKLGSWRLDGCTLYVTLEPCPMCAGAILGARIERVVYGAKDPKAGCFGSRCDFTAMQFPTVPYVRSGILEAECKQQLDSFFKALRKKETTECC